MAPLSRIQLQAAGETDVRSRMLHVLNDALSTCDRAGRKRRRSDFTLGVRIEDVAGGRLGSGGGDEDRLTVQKRRCACRIRHVFVVSHALCVLMCCSNGCSSLVTRNLLGSD